MAGEADHRHGGPDAGWYVPADHGWQRISDHEVRDHEDAAHFMSDPNGRHGPGERVIEPPTMSLHVSYMPAWKPGEPKPFAS